MQGGGSYPKVRGGDMEIVHSINNSGKAKKKNYNPSLSWAIPGCDYKLYGCWLGRSHTDGTPGVFFTVGLAK